MSLIQKNSLNYSAAGEHPACLRLYILPCMVNSLTTAWHSGLLPAKPATSRTWTFERGAGQVHGSCSESISQSHQFFPKLPCMGLTSKSRSRREHTEDERREILASGCFRFTSCLHSQQLACHTRADARQFRIIRNPEVRPVLACSQQLELRVSLLQFAQQVRPR